jgi:hypothetical protein
MNNSAIALSTEFCCPRMSESLNALSDLPIIDVSKFLKQKGGFSSDCKTVLECLHKYGILIVLDPVTLYSLLWLIY